MGFADRAKKNADEHGDDNEFPAPTIIANGIYTVEVKKCWEAATANGRGRGLNIVLRIVSGRYEGEEYHSWYGTEYDGDPSWLGYHGKMITGLIAACGVDPEDPSDLEGCMLKAELVQFRDKKKQETTMQVKRDGFYAAKNATKRRAEPVEGASRQEPAEPAVASEVGDEDCPF